MDHSIIQSMVGQGLRPGFFVWSFVNSNEAFRFWGPRSLQSSCCCNQGNWRHSAAVGRLVGSGDIIFVIRFFTFARCFLSVYCNLVKLSHARLRRTFPMAQISTALVYGNMSLPSFSSGAFLTSGAMKLSVPQRVWSRDPWLARPKSQSLIVRWSVAWSHFVTRMLGGLMSLWVMFLPWRYFRANNACVAIKQIPSREIHFSCLALICAYKSFTASSIKIQSCPLDMRKES